MCGRFFIDLTEEQLIGLYHFELSTAATRESDFAPRYNIAPTTPVLACRSVDPAGYELASMRWGLIPHWAKQNTFDGKTFNARSETAAEKPAYRDAMRTSRCLIPAGGFYEWPPGPSKRGVPKQPYRITLDSGPMMIAGLWSTWADPENPEAKAIESCAVLTRPSEGPLAEVHHRMPVMLPRDLWEPWLGRGAEVDHLSAMLMDTPCPPDMSVTPVSTRVNSVKNDSPDLLIEIDPDSVSPGAQSHPGGSIAGPESGQPSLFD